jgi:gluconolactonase
MAGSTTGGTADMPPTGSAVCPPGPYEAEPVVGEASPTPVCTGLSFAEGAVWFHDRSSLFFSDFGVASSSDNFNGSIVEYTPAGGCSNFIENAGTNGLAIGLDGSLIGCRHLDQTITAFDLTSKADTVIVPDFNGEHFSSPNDIAIRSDGNLYFTDPAWQLGNRDQELPQSVYRRDPEGNLSVVEALAERRPNGVSLSPNETLLYVAVINPNEIRVYDVDATGATSNARSFITAESSDGMVVDCAGNLYLTGGGGVTIYSPEGSSLGSISASSASNVAFGGPDRKTLFITAGSQLLSIELAIPGMPY